MHNGAGEVDHEQPTETTALLPARPLSQNTGTPYVAHLVEPVVLQIQAKGFASLTASDLCPEPLHSRANTVAFSLIVLFYSLSKHAQRSLRGDILQRWQAEKQYADDQLLINQRLLNLWAEFLDTCSGGGEIKQVMWNSFNYDSEERHAKRVVDFLSAPGTPQELLAHPIVISSVRDVWKQGIFDIPRDVPLPIRFLRNLDALCTPRVLHAVELFFLSAYLFALVSFLILPPMVSVDPTASAYLDKREGILILYSCARILQRPTASVIPFVLVLAAFIMHLPEVPQPNDFAYALLLFSFSWIVLDMHLPESTSPQHLFPAEHMLPRSVLIWHGVSHVFIPVVTFFLPALLLSLFLLSTSLADIFPGVLRATLSPAPIESRVAFLSLFAVLFLLMICCLAMLVLVYPSFVRQTPNPWDRYSRPIGTEARRSYIRTVVRYSTPYTFPPPLNLVSLFTRLPMLLLTLSGSDDGVAAVKVFERVLWRATVAPLGFLIGSFWLWGLTARY